MTPAPEQTDLGIKASTFVLYISVPCFFIAMGMDLYFSRGVIMSPLIVGDLIWFTVIPTCLYFMAKADEDKELRTPTSEHP